MNYIMPQVQTGKTEGPCQQARKLHEHLQYAEQQRCAVSGTLRGSASSNDLLDGNVLEHLMMDDAVISTIVRDKDATLTFVEGDPNAFRTILKNLPDGTSC
jgi:hypothetical protein